MLAKQTQKSTHELVLLAANVGHVHVVSGRAQIFQLFAGEDINSNQMDFSMAVLAGFGGTHFHNLAGTLFDNNMTILTESGALHGVSG